MQASSVSALLAGLGSKADGGLERKSDQNGVELSILIPSFPSGDLFQLKGGPSIVSPPLSPQPAADQENSGVVANRVSKFQPVSLGDPARPYLPGLKGLPFSRSLAGIVGAPMQSQPLTGLKRSRAAEPAFPIFSEPMVELAGGKLKSLQGLQPNSNKRQKTSSYRGVTYNHLKGGWDATAEQKLLGTFPSELLAAVAVDEAIKAVYGSFAEHFCNFESDQERSRVICKALGIPVSPETSPSSSSTDSSFDAVYRDGDFPARDLYHSSVEKRAERRLKKNQADRDRRVVLISHFQKLGAMLWFRGTSNNNTNISLESRGFDHVSVLQLAVQTLAELATENGQTLSPKAIRLDVSDDDLPAPVPGETRRQKKARLEVRRRRRVSVLFEALAGLLGEHVDAKDRTAVLEMTMAKLKQAGLGGGRQKLSRPLSAVSLTRRPLSDDTDPGCQ